ncbi:MAG: hypothetical protein ACRDPY_32740 [Streptosporangiaceae bacterium]
MSERPQGTASALSDVVPFCTANFACRSAAAADLGRPHERRGQVPQEAVRIAS